MEFGHFSLQFGDGLLGSQVFDFVGGLFLLLIGATLLYNAAVWRWRGTQVNGELIGVRRRGPSWHGVYQYVSPDGRVRQATSVQGHGGASGFQSGRRVPLQVMPDQPDEARERHAPMSWALAIGSLLAGAWLVYVGATVAQHGVFVWLLIVLAVSFTGRWLWRRATSVLARMQPMVEPTPWSALPIERVEDLGADASSTPRVRVTGASPRRAGTIFIVAGVVLFAIGAWQARGLLELRQGVRTSGQVVELSEGGAGRSGDTFFFPVVQYLAADRTVVRFHDRVGARPSPFKVGDTVAVRYVPGAPATAAIDRGLASWEPLAALLVMGTTLTGLGVFARRGT